MSTSYLPGGPRPVRLLPPAPLSPARRFLRDLKAIRHMPAEADNQPKHLIQWGVVATNAVGVVLGLALTSVTAGMFYLVWRLPTQQNEVLRSLQEIQRVQVATTDELKRLEINDRRQDDRLTKIEFGR
jgi:hypothetical protein